MSGCQLFCNPDGTTNGLATFLVYAVLALIVGGVVLMVAAYVVTTVAGPGRTRRPAPVGSPVVRGRRVRWGPLTYSAPVSAVTPGGVRVRHGRCCQRGHQYPEDAARHALVVGDRIARFGR